MESLNATGSRIVLVAGSDMKLAGIVTDGDLRRGLLTGASLTDPVTAIMSRGTATARPSDSNAHLAALMTGRSLHLPVVDEAGHLVGLKTLAEVMTAPSRENWVVLMAGGLGTRLRPLTDNTPKPMLPVGGIRWKPFWNGSRLSAGFIIFSSPSITGPGLLRIILATAAGMGPISNICTNRSRWARPGP